MLRFFLPYCTTQNGAGAVGCLQLIRGLLGERKKAGNKRKKGTYNLVDFRLGLNIPNKRKKAEKSVGEKARSKKTHHNHALSISIMKWLRCAKPKIDNYVVQNPSSMLQPRCHLSFSFAVKYIDRCQKIDEHVEREILNHKSLKHPNIIRFKELPGNCYRFFVTFMEICRRFI
ncbi:hypothetical protein L6452_24587 [Arctium lappa]|uniref:Uncharacterized protein n=1 Tax=Arctium lappa TaxID=4217 RepID=A0ACB9AA06_ARCLA|nr:hypothetical protein L6452_24587 [Arctium lappa]